MQWLQEIVLQVSKNDYHVDVHLNSTFFVTPCYSMFCTCSLKISPRKTDTREPCTRLVCVSVCWICVSDLYVFLFVVCVCTQRHVCACMSTHTHTHTHMHTHETDTYTHCQCYHTDTLSFLYIYIYILYIYIYTHTLTHSSVLKNSLSIFSVLFVQQGNTSIYLTAHVAHTIKLHVKDRDEADDFYLENIGTAALGVRLISTISQLALPCLALPCFFLPCLACLVLPSLAFCLVLPYLFLLLLVLSCLVLLCPTLLFVMPCIILLFVLSCLTLFFILPCFTVSCLALRVLALSCHALTCLVLSCSALPWLVWSVLALSCFVLLCPALSGLVLPCLVLPSPALPCLVSLALSCLAFPCPVLPHLWGDKRCVTPPPPPSLHYHQTKLNPVSVTVSSLSLDSFLTWKSPASNIYICFPLSPTPTPTPTPLHNPDMSVTFTRPSHMTDAPFHTQTSIHSAIASSLCYDSFTTSSMSIVHILTPLVTKPLSRVSDGWCTH